MASASLRLHRAGGGLADWVMYDAHDLTNAAAVAGIHGATSASDERFGPRTAALAEDLSNGWHHVPLREVLSRPKPEAGLTGRSPRRGVVLASGCRQSGGRRRRPATLVAATFRPLVGSVLMRVGPPSCVPDVIRCWLPDVSAGKRTLRDELRRSLPRIRWNPLKQQESVRQPALTTGRLRKRPLTKTGALLYRLFLSSKRPLELTRRLARVAAHPKSRQPSLGKSVPLFCGHPPGRQRCLTRR